MVVIGRQDWEGLRWGTRGGPQLLIGDQDRMGGRRCWLLLLPEKHDTRFLIIGLAVACISP